MIQYDTRVEVEVEAGVWKEETVIMNQTGVVEENTAIIGRTDLYMKTVDGHHPQLYRHHQGQSWPFQGNACRSYEVFLKTSKRCFIITTALTSITMKLTG